MNKNPSRIEIRRLFPNLDDADLTITSPRTPTYNCIAYAAGDQSRWWWPDPLGLFYWPRGVQRTERMPAFQAAFETLGYRLDGNLEVEEGFERIALYCKDGKPTHAARQLISGAWSSKLGQLEDISHDFDGLGGESYGAPSVIMRRPRVLPA